MKPLPTFYLSTSLMRRTKRVASGDENVYKISLGNPEENARKIQV
jgi:hypothetical protein